MEDFAQNTVVRPLITLIKGGAVMSNLQKQGTGYFRIFISVAAWLGSVLLFLLSAGRIKEFSVSLYNEHSFIKALQAMSTRPVPLDEFSYSIGIVMLTAWLISAAKYKGSWFRIQVTSMKTLPFGFLLLAGANILGEMLMNRNVFLHLKSTAILGIMLAYLCTSIVALTYLIRHHLKDFRTSTDPRLECTAPVWVGMAIYLTAVQVIAITVLRT
ncbi:hypothetical protein [Ferriphaselus sp. R-1]|uniref:hypothetical protein n=1 Tax=Ferriphaselus sp. R-1 TaxID=1485544 RepID=UPI0005536D5B|nr:hypothetical protein [Ferriphaselus sp. R-1]